MTRDVEIEGVRDERSGMWKGWARPWGVGRFMKGKEGSDVCDVVTTRETQSSNNRPNQHQPPQPAQQHQADTHGKYRYAHHVQDIPR